MRVQPLAAPAPHPESAPEPWLTVVGALPGGALAPTAPPGALTAEAVFGPARLLAAAGVVPERQRPWPSPFADGVAALLARRGRATTVLASGDPLHHGIAATLLAHLAPEEMAVHPAPSAFSLAAAALRWPLAETTCVSLHTAAPEEILAHVAPGRRLLVLTRDGAAPHGIAAALCAAGWGESPVAVCEALGGPEAAVRRATAATLARAFHPLNVLAIHCRRPDPVRAAAARRNLAAAAVPARLLEGDAAARLTDAPPPDRIFLGGAVADGALFAALWDRLAPGGIIVSNAVTLDGEAATLARHARHGGTLLRIALSHAAPVGRLLAMKPAMPVLQWRAIKPAEPLPCE